MPDLPTRLFAVWMALHSVAGAGGEDAGTAPARAAPAPAQGYEVDTLTVARTRIEYRIGGTGHPAVVFEAGFGGNLDLWDAIFSEVAKFTTAFAYSRPGSGTSGATKDDADGIRTSDEAAITLRRTLRAAGVRSPYVLVGASLGGLYVQKFAQRYPSDTAAIVLVDNRPPTFLKRCRAALIKQCMFDSRPAPEWPAHLRATFAGIETSEANAPREEELGGLPVTVITAMVAEMPDAEAFLQLLVRAQTEYAAALKNGRHVLAHGAGHESLTNKDSGVVIDEIRRISGVRAIANSAMVAAPAPAVALREAGDSRSRQRVELGAEAAQAITGVYENPRLGRFVISAHDRALRITGGVSEAELSSIGEDEFVLVRDGIAEAERFKVIRADSGAVVAVMWDGDRYDRR